MRLPSYRSAYLIRHHPYPRAKLSTRELLMALKDDSGDRETSTNNDGGEESEEGTVATYPPTVTDISEEQHVDVVNLQGTMEGVEAATRPPVWSPILIIVVVDLAVLVILVLTFKTMWSFAGAD